MSSEDYHLDYFSDDDIVDRDIDKSFMDDLAESNNPSYHQWFLDECFELYLLLKDWTERNGLALCENLTTEHLEDFLSNNFIFSDVAMDLDNSRFMKWKSCYEKWLEDICYYELRWTLFNSCPVQNFFWFVFMTSSGSVSEFA